MNAKQKLHQVHLQEWTVRFADQKASGLTVRQWCEQNNLSFHTYNYWKHLLKSVMSLRPLTCHIPVIPGLMAILARWCSSYCSSSSGRMGRVPANVNIGTTFFQK